MPITVDGQIGQGSLAADSVGTVEIIDGDVMEIDIATGAITSSKIAGGAVDDSKITGPISIAKLDTDPLARANHTGTQTLSTISDAGTAASADSADLLARANHTGTQALSTISDAGTSAGLDVPAVGDAAVGEVVKGDDSRLTDARTPTAHTHVLADVTDAGTAAASAATDFVAVAGDTMTGQLSMQAPIRMQANNQHLYLEANTDLILNDTGNVVRHNAVSGQIQSNTNASNGVSGLGFQGTVVHQATNTQYFQDGGLYWASTLASAPMVRGRATGRTNPNVGFFADGKISWDYDDNNVFDTIIENTAAGVLAITTGKMQQAAAPTVGDDLTNKTYVDSQTIFGDEYQLQYEGTQLDSTSGTYAQFMRLTTPSIPAGTYRVLWSFQYNNTNAATTGQFRLQVDDTTDVVEKVLSAPANTPHFLTDLDNVVLTAGVHTFDIDMLRASGSGTFTLDEGKIELWRIA